MRAFTALWDEITRERYGVEDPKARRLRYGVQVNSLGLTEAQPENNVQRIVLEMLAVSLSRGARARAIQLPAWNEALGLPRPWDQQWALRMQQVLAYETDLLEYEDIFDGSHVIQSKVDEIMAGAREEIARVQELGGAVAAVESGYMKSQLVSSFADYRREVETGEQVLVGVEQVRHHRAVSPLQAEGAKAIETIDPVVEKQAVSAHRGVAVHQARQTTPSSARWRTLRVAAKTTENLFEATVDCARGRGDHRRVVGRAARGVRRVPGPDRRVRGFRLPGDSGEHRSGCAARVRRNRRRNSGSGCASWSASRASTGTPTAPSRSPSGRATSASRSSTRASG